MHCVTSSVAFFPTQEVWNMMSGIVTGRLGSWNLLPSSNPQLISLCQLILKEKNGIKILQLIFLNYITGSSCQTLFDKNFDICSHSRPRWALIDKAFMHNTWRSSQASYHLYRTSGNFCPSNHVTMLMDDLLSLCLHSYETVRL